jgi:hypothetical protein
MVNDSDISATSEFKSLLNIFIYFEMRDEQKHFSSVWAQCERDCPLTPASIFCKKK